jgi:hypothetical protein
MAADLGTSTYGPVGGDAGVKHREIIVRVDKFHERSLIHGRITVILAWERVILARERVILG